MQSNIKENTKKALKAISKDLKNIQELPSGWVLLDNLSTIADDIKKMLNFEDSLKKAVAILVTSYIEHEKTYQAYQIIGKRDALMNKNIENIKLRLLTSGNKVFITVADEDGKLIEEIYKTAKEGVKDDDKDYSKSDGIAGEVNDLFLKAVRQGVSDIHLEVRKGYAKVRARINGRISNFYSTAFAETTGLEWGRVIYQVMSSISNATFNPKIQQDALVVGIFGDDKNKVKLRVRVATNPSEPSGFDMTMRLLIIQDSKKPLTLEQLGYNKKITHSIKMSMAQPVGLTIIAGTTGSGKSTTLQNILLAKINEKNGEIKVITVEDPPEYFIPGATQVPVIRDEKGDATIGFAKAIKAAMRSDPDIIMVGEIRDNQSASLTVQAVQSGHQVYSTIHAQSALGILPRFENLGIGRDILGSPEFISGLVYQKLLPVLCDHCFIPFEEDNIPNKYSLEKIVSDNNILSESEVANLLGKVPNKVNFIRFLQDIKKINSTQAEFIFEEYRIKNPEEEKEEFLVRLNSYYGDLSKLNLKFQGDGCRHCKLGIKARTVVAEIVRPDIHMLDLITQKRDSELLTYWKKTLGGKYAAEDAYEKIKEGLVSPLDVEDQLGLIGSKLI